MLSATASLGLSLLWDTDIGLSHVDKYTYSSEENIKVDSSCPLGVSAWAQSFFSRLELFSPLVSSTQVYEQKQMRHWLFSGNTQKTSLFL
jgi:hypothetical protein